MMASPKFLLALLPVLLVAACGGGDDSLDDRIGVADPKVRMVHAVPLAPSVSLFRNGVAQAGDVTTRSAARNSRCWPCPMQAR